MEASSAGWKRGFRVKGWKAFLFAARVPTLHVVFTEKCTFTDPGRRRKRLGCSFRALVFNLSLSLSLYLSAFALNSLLLYSKPRSFFFEHGFSSSTRASVRGNRSRERDFSWREIVAPRARFPTITPLASFCARLNIISYRETVPRFRENRRLE